jgi:hypothetical protein
MSKKNILNFYLHSKTGRYSFGYGQNNKDNFNKNIGRPGQFFVFISDQTGRFFFLQGC